MAAFQKIQTASLEMPVAPTPSTWPAEPSVARVWACVDDELRRHTGELARQADAAR